jgi:hypothetical protein
MDVDVECALVDARWQGRVETLGEAFGDEEAMGNDDE